MILPSKSSFKTRQDEIDVALSIAIGSATQIALFVPGPPGDGWELTWKNLLRIVIFHELAIRGLMGFTGILWWFNGILWQKK